MYDENLSRYLKYIFEITSVILNTFLKLQLERYFQKTKSHEDNHTRRRRAIRGGLVGDLEDSSMEVSKDNSRASSVENDLTTDSNTRQSFLEEDLFDDVEEVRPRRRGRKAGTKNGQKRPVTKLSKGNSLDENSIEHIGMTDSNSSAPSPPPVSDVSSRPLRSSAGENTQERKFPVKRGPVGSRLVKFNFSRYSRQ